MPVEYRILGFGIRNTAEGIQNSIDDIRIQNPSSTDKESGIQYLESGIHGVESRIRDCLGAFVHTWNTTVKHRLKATSLVRPLFLAAWQKPPYIFL